MIGAPSDTSNNPRIHPSRVIRFVGKPHPDPMSVSEVWGDPVLQVIDDAVKAAGLVSGSLATLVNEAKIDVIKIPQLTDSLQTEAGTSRLLKRFTSVNAAKSVINAILMDKDEDWERINVAFAGLPDVLLVYLLIACGAADIPATRLLGQSPIGLNATGESDLRNYYDRLKSDQSTKLTPVISPLDEIIIRAALGTRDPAIHYEWNSLWQLSPEQKGALAVQKANAHKVDVDSGLIPPLALGQARVNQLVEDVLYPGLEAAIEEAEAQGETVGEPPEPEPEPGYENEPREPQRQAAE